MSSENSKSVSLGWAIVGIDIAALVLLFLWLFAGIDGARHMVLLSAWLVALLHLIGGISEQEGIGRLWSASGAGILHAATEVVLVAVLGWQGHIVTAVALLLVLVLVEGLVAAEDVKPRRGAAPDAQEQDDDAPLGAEASVPAGPFDADAVQMAWGAPLEPAAAAADAGDTSHSLTAGAVEAVVRASGHAPRRRRKPVKAKAKAKAKVKPKAKGRSRRARP